MPIRVSLAALVLLALSVPAFWPQYLSRLAAAHRHVHVHAVLGTGWLLLLVVQPWLVATSRRGAHRLLGRIGWLLGAAFFVSGVITAQRSIARMSPEQFAHEGRYVYLPLAMAAFFGIALLMAIVWRSTPAVHGRFMAATALPLLDPVLARLIYQHAPPLPAEFLYQLPAFVIVGVVLAAMLASLPATARGRIAFKAFSLAMAALLLGLFFVPHTGSWLSFVSWLRGISIT